MAASIVGDIDTAWGLNLIALQVSVNFAVATLLSVQQWFLCPAKWYLSMYDGGY